MSTTHSVDLQLHYHDVQWATIPLPPKAHPFLSLFLFHVPIYSYDTLACSAEKISNYGRINRCRRLESMDETPAITLYHKDLVLSIQSTASWSCAAPYITWKVSRNRGWIKITDTEQQLWMSARSLARSHTRNGSWLAAQPHETLERNWECWEYANCQSHYSRKNKNSRLLRC